MILYALVRACVHAIARVCVCMYARARVCVFACMCVYVCAYACICLCVLVCVYIYVCAYALFVDRIHKITLLFFPSCRSYKPPSVDVIGDTMPGDFYHLFEGLKNDKFGWIGMQKSIHPNCWFTCASRLILLRGVTIIRTNCRPTKREDLELEYARMD